jgi:cytidyltransferase-like protein
MIIKKLDNIIEIDPRNLEKGQKYNAAIAYFGGTFDPFHLGHFLITSELISLFDEVWIHPHSFSKSKKPIELKKRQEIILLGIKNLKKTFLMKYYPDNLQNEYYLPHFLEEKIEGLNISDVIGDDHLNRIISQGIERPLYCFARSNKFCKTINHPQVYCMTANTAGINATNIRNKIIKEELNDLPIQKEVFNYIKKEGLYKKNSTNL